MPPCMTSSPGAPARLEVEGYVAAESSEDVHAAAMTLIKTSTRNPCMSSSGGERLHRTCRGERQSNRRDRDHSWCADARSAGPREAGRGQPARAPAHGARSRDRAYGDDAERTGEPRIWGTCDA